MAFDGVTIHALLHELNTALCGGRLYKIAQPEKDELFITIKNGKEQYRLMLSVNASLPLAYLAKDNKPSPMTAPNFCMLLRKHVNNGRIIEITQPGLERILDFKIEHLDEMGDLCTKHLIIELMGKHSNIIFTNEAYTIIDSIKRINAGVSSVREVLPGLDYFIPNTTGKSNPLTTTSEEFIGLLSEKNTPVSKAIYTSYTGISPQFAEDTCFAAGIDSRPPFADLSDTEKIHLSGIFLNKIDDVKNNVFSPCIIYKNGQPCEFCVYLPEMYSDCGIKEFSSVSLMLESYYAEKNSFSRIHQRSTDLRQVVNTLLERNYKKLDLQQKQLKDTEKRDTYRIYGELINTYGYNIPEGAASFEALNYYDNTTITIPLDKDLSIRENSVKYFNKYNKLKRTFEALSSLTLETQEEIDHLESISTALDIAASYDDLLAIREELQSFGYMKTKFAGKKGKAEKSHSKPFHYLSSDGFHIYVGKNNFQNEDLTFKFASGNDWWFHAKGMPGSHVIVKAENKELPDRTFEEAAALAAFYSKGRGQEKVEIDYVEKKQVKKVNGKAPGFVIYHTNYSMIISPDISGIQLIE